MDTFRLKTTNLDTTDFEPIDPPAPVTEMVYQCSELELKLNLRPKRSVISGLLLKATDSIMSLL